MPAFGELVLASQANIQRCDTFLNSCSNCPKHQQSLIGHALEAGYLGAGGGLIKQPLAKASVWPVVALCFAFAPVAVVVVVVAKLTMQYPNDNQHNRCCASIKASQQQLLATAFSGPQSRQSILTSQLKLAIINLSISGQHLCTTTTNT